MRAGKTLAAIDKIDTTTNHKIKPVGVYVIWVAASKSAMLMLLDIRLLIGKASSEPIAKLIAPMRNPSMITIRVRMPFDAPTARMMPISRVRSITFMLIVPARPILPTIAARIAINSRKAVKIPKPLEAVWLMLRPASTFVIW